jgi:hypothetical protein
VRALLPFLALLALTGFTGCTVYDFCTDQGMACVLNHADGSDRCWLVESEAACPFGAGAEGYVYHGTNCAALGFERECYCQDHPDIRVAGAETCLREGVNCRCDN